MERVSTRIAILSILEEDLPNNNNQFIKWLIRAEYDFGLIYL